MINPSFVAEPPTFPPPKTCGACGHCQLPDADLRCGDLAYCTSYCEFVKSTGHPVDYDCEEYYD